MENPKRYRRLENQMNLSLPWFCYICAPFRTYLEAATKGLLSFSHKVFSGISVTDIGISTLMSSTSTRFGVKRCTITRGIWSSSALLTALVHHLDTLHYTLVLIIPIRTMQQITYASERNHTHKWSFYRKLLLIPSQIITLWFETHESYLTESPILDLHKLFID